MTCNCFIIPDEILQHYASDPELSNEVRQNFSRTASLSRQMRLVRDQSTLLTQMALNIPLPFPRPFPFPKLHLLPPSEIHDLHHGTTLPGAGVPNPGGSPDGSVKRAYDESVAVAKFYWDIFKRDSIDGHHMTMVSSVHYGVKFNNAFWNGAQMTYGDGDGQIFLDFTLGNDVIGHELTHGVTQHSAGLVYNGEAGGLNESMSDVFGSMFRQWRANQVVGAADWLIGKDIIGPVGHQKGFTCLRNMCNPKDTHALAPQPDHYYPGIGNLDPHYSSGPPNFAFYKAATAIGGHSWDQAGHIWYQALTSFPPSPNLTMSQFASRTRALSTSLYPATPAIHTAVHNAWTAVGL